MNRGADRELVSRQCYKTQKRRIFNDQIVFLLMSMCSFRAMDDIYCWCYITFAATQALRSSEQQWCHFNSSGALLSILKQLVTGQIYHQTTTSSHMRQKKKILVAIIDVSMVLSHLYSSPDVTRSQSPSTCFRFRGILCSV